MRQLLETLVELDAAVKRAGFPEAELMAEAGQGAHAAAKARLS